MLTAQLPKVQLTTVFRQALALSGRNPNDFATGFATWKAAGKPGLLKDPYFGRDGPYARPLRQNKVALWHVHLRPDSDPTAAIAWDNNTRTGTPKASDAVLIYTHNLNHGYLLLHAVWDKGAHDFANMTTPAAFSLMNNLANVAEEFIFWGRIII